MRIRRLRGLGLCLSTAAELPTLAVVQGAAPAGGVLGWVTPAGQELRAEGFDPTAKTRHRGSVVSPRTSVLANLALGADGALRVGLGSQGSARLPLLGDGEAVLRPAPGLGALALGDGRALLLEVVGDRLQLITDGTSNISDGTSNITDGTSTTRGIVVNHEEGFRASVAELPTLAADPVVGDRAFILAAGALFSVQVPAGAARVDVVRRADATGVPAGSPWPWAPAPTARWRRQSTAGARCSATSSRTTWSPGPMPSRCRSRPGTWSSRRRASSSSRPRPPRSPSSTSPTPPAAGRLGSSR